MFARAFSIVCSAAAVMLAVNGLQSQAAACDAPLSVYKFCNPPGDDPNCEYNFSINKENCFAYHLYCGTNRQDSRKPMSVDCTSVSLEVSVKVLNQGHRITCVVENGSTKDSEPISMAVQCAPCTLGGC